MSYANNKDADQPAYPRSLISAFVVRCIDSVISLVSVTKSSSLMLASVAEQASLSLTSLEPPEGTFSHGEAHLNTEERLHNKTPSSSVSNCFSPYLFLSDNIKHIFKLNWIIFFVISSNRSNKILVWLMFYDDGTFFYLSVLSIYDFRISGW